MTPPRLPQLGSVVWVELADANGIVKVRPAVVVSASADIAAGGPVRVAAITTRIPLPLPADHLLLPWDRQGKARSGLRRKSAAVASWVAEVPLGEVRQVVGILPPVVVTELLTKVAAATPSPPAVPPPMSPPPTPSP